MVYDENGSSRGFGFVNVATEQERTELCAKCNEMKIGSRNALVQPASKSRRGGGGVYYCRRKLVFGNH